MPNSLTGIFLILLGVLAAPSLLLAKRPDAQPWLEKLVPYQGWIGVVFCVLGVLGVVRSLLHMSPSILWLILLASSALMAALGFILGYSLITGFMGSSPEARAKAAQLLAKLAPIQGKLGLAAICLGGFCVVVGLLYGR